MTAAVAPGGSESPGDPAEARAAAAAQVAQLRAVSPRSLELGGADLGPALEQQLFFALRDAGAPASAGGPFDGARAWARLAGMGVAGMVAMARGTPRSGSVVALVRQEVHLAALALVQPELERLGGPPLTAVRIGPAARRPFAAAVPTPSIADVLDVRRLPALAAYQLRVRRLGQAGLPAGLAAFARGELPRIGAGAVGVESVIRRYRPSLLVSFDEVGTWARIIPSVARQFGMRTLDLPHAEAADPVAIAGAGYDDMAVYGPRARQVLERAGIASERIHEIGAPRFDPLVAGLREPARPTEREAVVFAAQYVTGRLTPDVLAVTLRAAVAAAAATGSPLLVVPHPAEPAGTLERMLAHDPPPANMTVSTAAGGLHAALAVGWLLITGWSNSVMEAAIAGIPSITVNPGGVAPVDFAADGLAVGAADEGEAAAAARRLRDAGEARAAVERARLTLRDRLGPLDGRAAERAARLIRTLALGPAGGRSSASA